MDSYVSLGSRFFFLFFFTRLQVSGRLSLTLYIFVRGDIGTTELSNQNKSSIKLKSLFCTAAMKGFQRNILLKMTSACEFQYSS